MERPDAIVSLVARRFVAKAATRRLQHDDRLVALEAGAIGIVGKCPENKMRVRARIPMSRRCGGIADARVKSARRHESDRTGAHPYARGVISDAHGRVIR